MRTDGAVFDAVCRQSGVIRVDDFVALNDLAAVLSYVPLPKGNRIAIMTMGGGMGVIAADQCERAGLEIPALSPALITRFDELFPPFWSRANPVDMINSEDKTLPLQVMEALCAWDGCDVILHLGLLEQSVMAGTLLDALPRIDPDISEMQIAKMKASNEALNGQIFDAVLRLTEQYQKPIIGMGTTLGVGEDDNKIVCRTNEAGTIGCLFLPEPERAVCAIEKMVAYGRYRRRE
jgi:acyl-CoA synthetase (NDP forming)